MLKIGLNGASGRMGTEILDMIRTEPEKYVLGFAKSNQNKAQNLKGITSFPISHTVDVVIDFSSPESSMEALYWCQHNRVPIVIGTTGFNDLQIKEINNISNDIPIVLSPNMSLSVNVLFSVVKLVSAYLPNAEVEIIESHHRNKKDAPSGTALRIGRSVAEGRGLDFNLVANYDRVKSSSGIRKPEEIGFAVIRGGDIVGKHTASFILNGEEFNLTSEITNRRSFAAGSLVAAEFIFDKANGLFSMSDVLNIRL